MAISGVSTSGIMSGLNSGDLISQMLQIEHRPVDLLKIRQQDYEIQTASVLTLSTKLSAYKSSIESLNDSGKFNTKSASVTNASNGTELLTVSSSTDAAEGSYDIQVNQLATSSKKASGGWIDQNTTAIASAAGSFKFKVGLSGAVTSIGITSSTTLQGLRDSINSADAGVSASIINDGTGSNPYRLVISSKDTGSSNNIYITGNDTVLDLANKKVEAGYSYTENTYSGTFASNEGNNYTGTTNKTILMESVTAGASGTATYKYSVDGGINWLGYGGAAYDADAVKDTSGGGISTSAALKAIDGDATSNEGVEASFAAGSDLAVGDRFTIDVFNPDMQEAKDAVIEIDNATIVKSTNSITDAIEGVTMDLLKADTSSTLTLTVSSSSASAKSAIESFVTSYNDLYSFISEQLSYDPETGVASPLLGDPTLLEIRRKISDTVTGMIPGLSNDAYTNLSQIGITTNYKTGQLSMDSSKLSTALSSDPVAVSKLFVAAAEVTNQSIVFESKSADTRAGKYSVSISTAPEQATMTADNDLSTTTLLSDEVLILKYSTNNTEVDATYTAFSTTLTAGSNINTIVNDLNSSFATNNAAFTASKTTDGKLKITSDEYGEDIWFKVTTDQGDAAGQVWDTSGSREDDGVDVVGSINNHIATGVGNILTSASGFNEDGLSISTTSNQTGLFGSITVSRGISDILPTILDSYVNSETGVLRSKESSMRDSIDDIGSRIQEMEKRLDTKEERLHAEFARLEVLLARYDSLAQYLTGVLQALPQIGK